MGFILILAQNPNIRRFCVDNLVIRGYPAIGLSSVVAESDALLEGWVPDCVLMYGEPEQLEPGLGYFRSHEPLSAVPIVIISRDKPDPDWMALWKVSAHISSFPDIKYLVDRLKPWLGSTPSAKTASDEKAS